jgi:hypothetical protein
MFCRHNPIFKVVEALGMGVTMGSFVVMTTRSLNNMAIYPITEGSFVYILPLALGLLVLAQLSRQYMWVARIGIAIILGVGVGTNAYGVIGSDIMGSLKATLTGYPLYVAGDPVMTLTNILVIVLFIGTLAYFIFGREQTGAWGYLTKIGRWGMMICFGVAFGGILWFRETLTENAVVLVLQNLGVIPTLV